MSDSTLTLVLTLLLGGFVLAALVAPLRRRAASLSLAQLPPAPDEGAIDAAGEIAFDRAIGKLTDADVEALAARYALSAAPTATSASAPAPVTTAPAAGPAPTGAAFCHQCGAALLPGARFCHVCGTPTPAAAGAVSGAPTAPAAAPLSALPAELAAPVPAAAGSGSIVPWAVAFVVLLSAVGFLAGRQNGDTPAAQAAQGAGAPPNAPFANGATGPAPDISNMTPVERAQRLFDRIRAAAQAGDTARVNTFLPMALAAYDMIPGPDKTEDARFAQATLAELAGAPALVRAQADTILAARPTHLLGLILRVRHALMTGDAAAVTAARDALLKAQPGEMATPRPEYARFQGAIAQAIDDARGVTPPAGGAAPPNAPAAPKP